jgi:hypothetical protein
VAAEGGEQPDGLAASETEEGLDGGAVEQGRFEPFECGADGRDTTMPCGSCGG